MARTTNRFIRAIPILMLALLVLSSFGSTAQSKIKVFGRKCPKVTITDPGELFSTYTFQQAETDQIRALFKKAESADEVIGNSTEDHWPTELAKLDYRIDHPDVLRSMVVYLVADLGDKIVVALPPKQNSHLPDGVRPGSTVFLVIGKSGIKE